MVDLPTERSPNDALCDDCQSVDEICSLGSSVEQARGAKLENKLELAKKEDCAVWYLRILCFFFLGVFALAVILPAFFKFSRKERDDFERAFDSSADMLLTTIDRVAEARSRQISNFANDITSHAEFTNKKFNVTWPLVSLPDFESRASATARLCKVISILMFTRVTGEEKDEFLAYTQEEKGWIDESLSFNTGIDVAELNFTFPLGEDLIERSGVPGPGRYKSFEFGNASDHGYFAWQSYPMRKRATLLRDIPEGSGEGTAVAHVVATHQPAYNKSFHFMDLPPNTPNKRREAFQEYLEFYEGIQFEEDPAVNAYFPVFDKLHGDNRKVVAILLVGVYWRSYFVNIFGPGTPPMHIVLENTQNQTFTYLVEGNDASFVGEGDFHENAYTHKKRSYGKLALPENSQGSDVAPFCAYSIHVYPTKEMEDFFKTRGPLTFALSMALVFLLTSVVFLLYDLCVGLRQAKVLKSAQQSGSLVDNLFPSDVRTRLYQEQEVQERDEELQRPNWNLSPRRRKKGGENVGVESSAAIAKVHPECSILFADLKGFTKWSSTRSPSEVFELLETIYGAFDRSARRRGVFKIETIGDCYVAATGLPQMQHDHAVIMIKFASDIIRNLSELMATDLAERLGHDTRELELRVGVHSGPVTAGVLRGDKGRFQVFGNTVNVASRMESNGEGGRIQVSEDTAKLLLTSNRGHWLTRRPDLVRAKGKGDMQCYWVEVVSRTEGKAAASEDSLPASSPETSTSFC